MKFWAAFVFAGVGPALWSEGARGEAFAILLLFISNEIGCFLRPEYALGARWQT